MMLSNDYAGGK